MSESDRTYYLDLSDQANRQRIEYAQPGKTIRVLVKLAEDRQAAPTDAVGTLTLDRKDFLVEVKTNEGNFSHNRGWLELNEDLAAHEKHG